MIPPKLRAGLVGAAALAALALPASALADSGEKSLVSSLKTAAVVDGKLYSAKQAKQRFADTKLFFVLGSREEASGAVAGFTTRSAMKQYLRDTDRKAGAVKQDSARASWNGYESVFYTDRFLEGAAISVGANSSNGNLAGNCLAWSWWTCVLTFDNQISSAKTGYNGAYLYNWPYLNTTGGYVYIPGVDSVEVWRYFNDVTSSIFVP
jgi:hypothetical protein